jgi:bifunctional non-homologous end joining protein LigD
MDKLKEYTGKRTFDDTPEPEETIIESEEKNRFVVQKHDARREHYDFRLQVGDVLVSWAIPKQPVDDPEIKRLAIKVEDHPLSYIHFEGTIPKGNYGAGTVMVWDIGYYYINDSKDFPTVEAMQHKIGKGALKIYLQGAKLKGFYNLVELKNSTNNEWFFMKAKPTAAEADFENKSALSGRSMEEIAQSDRQRDDEKVGEIQAGEKSQPQKTSETMSAAKSDFPGFIQPMLATLTDRPFSKSNWLYELKLDGYRVIACKKGDETELFSRNGNFFTKTYPTIAGELSTLKAQFVIDGEVCYMDSVKSGENENRANFQKLQDDNREQENLHYYVFDILWLNGHDVKVLPLRERKKLLSVLLADPPPHIHYLDHVEENGVAYFEDIVRKRLEGMIAKRADSRYFPGNRSKDWLKVKTGHQQEMVICGFMPSEVPGRAFSSLLCAVYEAESLVYTGRVGTGFNEKMMAYLIEKLQELETDGINLENAPSESKIRWVQPQLVAEVKFAGWTNDGIMRHASFVGLRSDKEPEQIQFEQPVEPVISDPNASDSKVKLTNLSKIFWPDEGYTKGDVIAYYRDVAQVILPHLKDRPQSLYRTPNGIVEKGFFQKNVKEIAPDWVETVEIANSRGGKIEYLLCQDKDTLLYMANLGCIEINPWSSSLPKLNRPDFMIFDLDPVEVEFSAVVILAREFKKLFDQLGIAAYCKTSGSRGLHLYVPVQQKYTYEQVRNFVKLIEFYIHNQNKELTSFERSPEARKGRVYLDYLQNGKGKTMASVYSIRPRPGAMVSAPISWDELDDKLDPRKFTLATMRRRLERKGDLWQGIFDHRVDMRKVLAAFEG